MQLTVKLRHCRCQGDERHCNGYHGDDPGVCKVPRSRHLGLVFDPTYVQSNRDSDSMEYTGLRAA